MVFDIFCWWNSPFCSSKFHGFFWIPNRPNPSASTLKDPDLGAIGPCQAIDLQDCITVLARHSKALRNGDVTSKNGASIRKNRDLKMAVQAAKMKILEKKRIWPWVILILPRVSLGFGKPKSFQQSPYSGGHSRCRAVQACAAVREESARWVHSIPGGPGARGWWWKARTQQAIQRHMHQIPNLLTYMSLKWLNDEIIHSKSQYPGTKRPPTVYSLNDNHQHHHHYHHHHHHHHSHHNIIITATTTSSFTELRQFFSSSPISISSNEETITSPRFSFNANL